MSVDNWEEKFLHSIIRVVKTRLALGIILAVPFYKWKCDHFQANMERSCPVSFHPSWLSPRKAWDVEQSKEKSENATNPWLTCICCKVFILTPFVFYHWRWAFELRLSRIQQSPFYRTQTREVLQHAYNYCFLLQSGKTFQMKTNKSIFISKVQHWTSS